MQTLFCGFNSWGRHLDLRRSLTLKNFPLAFRSLFLSLSLTLTQKYLGPDTHTKDLAFGKHQGKNKFIPPGNSFRSDHFHMCVQLHGMQRLYRETERERGQRKDIQKKQRNRDREKNEPDWREQTKEKTDRYTQSRKREQVSATRRQRKWTSII